jgi:Ca2+-binding RTX toxin-like protein
LFGDAGDDRLYGGSGRDLLDGGTGENKLIDWSYKYDCPIPGNSAFHKTKFSAFASWVNSFLTTLAGNNGQNNPNGNIKITLPAPEDEMPKTSRED